MQRSLLRKAVIPFLLMFGTLILATLVSDALLHQFGLAWVGRWLGIPGTLLILASFLYSMRKRKNAKIRIVYGRFTRKDSAVGAIPIKPFTTELSRTSVSIGKLSRSRPNGLSEARILRRRRSGSESLRRRYGMRLKGAILAGLTSGIISERIPSRRSTRSSRISGILAGQKLPATKRTKSANCIPT